MKGLQLAPKLALPLDVAGEAIAILAKRGAGKTNTATVLVEEMHAAGVQVVVLDPVGAWWGLRHAADGKGEGLRIPILGGQHGDVPLEPAAGALIADVVVDSGESLLLDLSDFPSKASLARFVVDFAERLYRRKARASSLLHVVLEEADSFAPQRGGADDARMRGAVEQIVRRGRSRGIGVTMVTQRSAVLNKDVLSQADVLIAMRTTSPHDIAAIKLWISVHADEGEDEVVPSLPSLETGEAWVWNPERGLLDRVKVRRRRTFDSSATPKAGEKRVEPRQAAAIDIAALGEQIQATADQAKANDPKELRRQLAEARRELEQRPAGVGTKVERVEVPVFNGEVDRLDAAVRALRDVAGQLVEAGSAVAAAGEEVRGAATAVATAIKEAHGGKPEPARHRPAPARDQRAARPHRQHSRPDPPREERNVRPPTAGDFTPSSSQQRILDALAWFEALRIDEPSRPALAFVAGTRPTSGGFKNNLGALRTAGLLDYPTGGRVALTGPGRDAAAPPEFAPTDAELQAAVLERVTGSQAAILRTLIDAYPDELSREELAEAVGVPTTSGGFKNNLGALRTLELIDYPQPGYVVALPVLFPATEGGRA